VNEEAENLVMAVAAEILKHLEHHPNAADTARGVSEWWLDATRAQADIAIVELALQRLADQGMMRMFKMPDGKQVFSGRHSHGRGDLSQ
jgi:hypothetical protein